MTRGWRKLRNEELHKFIFTKCSHSDDVRKDARGNKKCVQNFCKDAERENENRKTKGLMGT